MLHPNKLIAVTSILFLVSCANNSIFTQKSFPSPNKERNSCQVPQRVEVYKEWVYDLNGYEGISGGSAYGLFDENAYVDPKGNSDYHPTTSPHPASGLEKYFPINRGNRIVVDLQKTFKISEIFLFDRSRQPDSVWVYTGTMKKWKLKAAFITKGDITQWGWKRLGIDDSTQCIMFRFRSWEAEITEAVIYGCPNGSLPAPPVNSYSGPRLPPKTIKEFLGVNAYNGSQAQWMKPFYNTRLYTNINNIDNDTTHIFPDIRYNTAIQGYYDGGRDDYYLFPDSIVRHNKAKIWLSLLGVPLWMEKKGFVNPDRPLTKLGMDPEDPMSYQRHANMMWNIAAAMGHTRVDTNLLQSYIKPRFTGRGLISVYENGNEVDANWIGTRYVNPMEYFARSTADYDGDENKLGNRMGIINADPGSQLMTAGFMTLDTNRLRLLDFISRSMRTDKQFIWKGGIQYHHYSTNGKGKLPGDVFYRATRGASPEEDSLRWRLKLVRDYTYRIQPKVECILGEWGYDKNQGSKMATPMVPGYNSQQSQGIMLLRGINAVAFSGFDKLIIYWIRDDDGDNSPGFFLSSGLVKSVDSSRDQRPYESWYYIATLVNQMGDYIPESIVSETGAVWVYKYRHKDNSSNKAYFVYCPSYTGKSIDDYTLNTRKLLSNSVKEISLLDNSDSGRVVQKIAGIDGIHLKVTEAPKIILVQEK